MRMKIKHTKRNLSREYPIHIILKTDLPISLQERESLGKIKSLITLVQKKYYINVFEYFVSKSHVHIFAFTRLPQNLSLAIQYLASQTARWFNKRLRRKKAFWSDRYFSSVKRTAAEIRRTVFYIANQIRNADPFKIIYSSLSEKKMHPFGFPPGLLRLVGIGTGDKEKLRKLIMEKGYVPHLHRTKNEVSALMLF
jgi:REP element-mobilizing transposase RayT